MAKEHDKLSNFQYSSLIASTIIGVLVIGLPKVAAVSANESAVLSTFIGGSLTAMIAVCIAILGRRFYNKTIVEYSTLLLGKILGKLFSVTIVIYFIVITSVTLRGFSDALKGLLLENTPLEIIMLPMLLTAVYLTLNGINGIAKVSELFLPVVIISLLLVIGLSISNFNFMN
ncbi:MAG TPA: GerAB/ArcD/ProY family transporter, partial [Clostridia bacterium]|nr:GerAB/ArcD/ProY family transporter [Clostridia bacterium]